MKGFIAGLVAAIGIAALVFVSPLIGLLVGMFIGWVLELVTGTYVTDGLNIIFGTDRFTDASLPQITGTLGVIGGFFKAKLTAKKEDD